MKPLFLPSLGFFFVFVVFLGLPSSLRALPSLSVLSSDSGSGSGSGGPLETMVVCSNCTNSAGCDLSAPTTRTFSIPSNSCISPLSAFPDDLDLWGPFDFLDECEATHVVRTFYGSRDGSCETVTDTYKLLKGVCLGPFGPDTPWGTFTCESESVEDTALE